MKIKDIICVERPTVSFEIFPPKPGADFEPVKKAAQEIAKLKPDFMSVTYGAGGGTSSNTIKIAGTHQTENTFVPMSKLRHDVWKVFGG